MASNGRVVVAFGIIAVMLVALLVLLASGGDDDPLAATSTSISSSTTSTTAPPTTTTTGQATTTTRQDPDARIAEVEQILTELEIRWYDAVYRGDEAALPEVVESSDSITRSKYASGSSMASKVP